MKKLQYRSMRGRRIKEYLAQVQSQKINDTNVRIEEPASNITPLESNCSSSTLKKGT